MIPVPQDVQYRMIFPHRFIEIEDLFGQAIPVDSPVQITDWMPTFCFLAGCRPERDLKWDGMNIASLLIDQEPLPERPLYAAAPSWRARSLRLGDWKLVVHGDGDARRVELFHLTEDPSEKNNQAEAQAERTGRLLRMLEDRAARDRDAVADDDA